MYKVLIADDDRLIREDVRHLVDWTAHGFEIVAEADHGAEALELAVREHADIVLTDINMPVMDGIELIRRVRERLPGVHCLVMSNYDDFDYVKEAMKLGAEDYILKYRLDPEVLLALLHQVKSRIEKRSREAELAARREEFGMQGQMSLTERFWIDCLTGELDDDSAAAQAERLDIPLSGGTWLPLLLEGGFRPESVRSAVLEQTEGECRLDVVRLGSRRTVLLLHAKERSYLILKQRMYGAAQAAWRSAEGKHAVVVMGEGGHTPKELRRQYRLMDMRAAACFYDGWNGIRDAAHGPADAGAEVDESAVERHEQLLLHALHAGDAEQASDELQALHGKLRSAAFDPAAVRNHIFMLMNQMYRVMKGKSQGFASSIDIGTYYASVHEPFCTLDRLTARLSELLDAFFGYGRTTAEPVRDEIRKALAYMEKHHASEVSLTDVAQHVGLSKNHFCKLFKQETGDNFINSLNRIRIERAKRIMELDERKFKEIAEQVGLENYRYFCRIFKQMTGVRPLDYKQSIARPR